VMTAFTCAPLDAASTSLTQGGPSRANVQCSSGKRFEFSGSPDILIACDKKI